jgi:hypothetical protein
MNDPVEAAGSSHLEEMLRIDESEQHGIFVRGKLYIVTGWIFEAPRMAIELPPGAKSKAAIACRPSRTNGKTSHCFSTDAAFKNRESPSAVTGGATGALAG